MSVNSTVASTRSGSGTCFVPVTNSSTWSHTSSGSSIQGQWSSPSISISFASGMRSAM
jgi:hypothetical protein